MLPCIAAICVGINFHVFADKGINYVMIFQLDPNAPSLSYPLAVAEAGAWLFLCWALVYATLRDVNV